MRIYSLNAENFKLDGGACFGVIPKSIWGKLCEVDENNMVDVALRSMLIKDENRLILIDTGIGNKQSEKFYSYQYITGKDNLSNSFATLGFSYDDVTDVILTHLHYDHCGGAVKYNDNMTKLEPTFKNARYWCSKSQWLRANNPYIIEKASYYKENYQPLMDKGVLTLIDAEIQLTPNIYLKIVNGHTDGQIVPLIKFKDKTIVFMADFVPSSAHIPIAYIPAFDYQPLISIVEKDEFLNKAVKENYILFFQHDFSTECCKVENTEKGFKVKESFILKTIVG